MLCAHYFSDNKGILSAYVFASQENSIQCYFYDRIVAQCYLFRAKESFRKKLTGEPREMSSLDILS